MSAIVYWHINVIVLYTQCVTKKSRHWIISKLCSCIVQVAKFFWKATVFFLHQLICLIILCIKVLRYITKKFTRDLYKDVFYILCQNVNFVISYLKEYQREYQRKLTKKNFIFVFWKALKISYKNMQRKIGV